MPSLHLKSSLKGYFVYIVRALTFARMCEKALNFSKVLNIVALPSKYTRALTFENLRISGAVTTPGK